MEQKKVLNFSKLITCDILIKDQNLHTNESLNSDSLAQKSLSVFSSVEHMYIILTFSHAGGGDLTGAGDIGAGNWDMRV